MFDLEEYLEFIEKIEVKEKSTKKVSINSALGRICAQDIKCKYDIPRFSNSAMDGFALRLGYETYEIVDDLFAGSAKNIEIKNNEAVRITTGAKIPQGAQAIIQKEKVDINGKILALREKIAQGQCIKLKGEDFKKGEIILKKGERISAQNIGLLASQGISKIRVFKKIRVKIFGSGNEIVDINKIPSESQIFDINSYFLRAIFSQLPMKISYGGILGDNPKKILRELKSASRDFDIIITSGGVSVGEKDYMHAVLKTLGAKILADSINIKPGRPVIFARREDCFILALPGNPIAAFFQALFVVPSLVKKFSAQGEFLRVLRATNESELNLTPKTAHIILGNLKNGKFRAFNNGKYQGAQVSPLLKSNAIAIFDDREIAHVGEILEVISYNFSHNPNATRFALNRGEK